MPPIYCNDKFEKEIIKEIGEEDYNRLVYEGKLSNYIMEKYKKQIEGLNCILNNTKKEGK